MTTDEFKPVSYGLSIKMADTPENREFTRKIREAHDRATREMTLLLSIQVKRGVFGPGTGEPLTAEEEAFSKELEDRAKWRETHCECCGHPYEDDV